MLFGKRIIKWQRALKDMMDVIHAACRLAQNLANDKRAPYALKAVELFSECQKIRMYLEAEHLWIQDSLAHHKKVTESQDKCSRCGKVIELYEPYQEDEDSIKTHVYPEKYCKVKR